MDRTHLAVLSAALAASLASTPLAARAEVFNADFTSAAQWAPSTGGALLNTAEGRVEAALSSNAAELDFGDGSDGDFADGASHPAISVVGSVITVDTGSGLTLRFKTFALGAGKTLKAAGGAPLVIRVQGAATIAGTIDLDGQDGAGTAGTGPAAGGAASAGGGKGGDAGHGVNPSFTDAVAGLPAAGSPVSGGPRGLSESGANEPGGGAGGCMGIGGGGTNATGGLGTTPTSPACSATTRVAIAGSFESAFSGGAGGGGGGAYTTAFAEVSGAGGGGGGGAIRFVAHGPLSFTGAIHANGGNGGENDTTNSGCSGGGGGGSGGAVWIQTRQLSGAGTVSVAAGAGGFDLGNCGGFSEGGTGSTGILRVDAASGSIAGATSVTTVAPQAGKTYSIASAPILLGYSYASIGTPTETVSTSASGCGTGGTLAVTYEGSDDGLSFGHEVAKDRISELNDYRYVRFKATIATTGGAAPCLTGLSIPYDARELTDLRLQGGLFCGSLGGKPGRRGGGPEPRDAAGDLLMIALAAVSALAAKPRRSNALH